MTEAGDPTQALPEGGRPVVAGRYRLDLLIGRGGTAEVWQATDTSLDRLVALKLVTAPHDESAVRAADEARTLAQLSHPSLVQVYDAGTDEEGRPWVVMEFVEGQTLADAMRRGPLPVRRVAEIGAAVAEGLAHVHARGLLHRDVKPANVLLGKDGSVKLTDFGIARLVDAARVTSTGLMVGTASYLAPEQVSGEPVGAPVDVYALGLVLLEALTGIREFEGPPVEAALARLHRDPTLPGTLPPGWAPVLAALTARTPAERPTAAQAAAMLRQLQVGETPTTVLVRPTTATTALPRPTVTPARRRTGWWLAAAVVAVLVLGALGYSLATRSNPTPRQIPPVSTDLPTPLQTDLNGLVQQVQR